MGLKKHICINCGKDFSNYFKDAKYCSRVCMNKYRKRNSILANKVCPICNKNFEAHNSKNIYCSKYCSHKAKQNRQKCSCDYCGKSFVRIKSELKNTKHYCSNECRKLAKAWNDNDIKILKENYNSLSYKEISNILCKKRSIGEIKRKAFELGITTNNKWSSEQIEKLKEIYPTKPLDEVLIIIGKTKGSILDKAHELGLKSYSYTKRKYKEDDIIFITNNFRKMPTSEIANVLGRTTEAIQQKAKLLGLVDNDIRTDSYSDLSTYIRKHLKPWKDKIILCNGNKCQLTNISGNDEKIVVHHIIGFNLLIKELIQITNYDENKDFKEYTNDELKFYLDQFLILQEKYKEYICITENIHKCFHNLYGYGNNTKEQWNDFLLRYIDKTKLIS